MKNQLLCAALLALAGASLPAWAQPADGIIREGEGQHRKALDARELKPFDESAWAKLSDWKNGGSAGPGAFAGRPVLIMTWTDYIPASKRAFATAKRLAETYAADGLAVVCAHGKDEWAAAQKPEAPKGATLLIAHDAKGEFRDAILADNDPDFFVIDRAGQLRFADIATESVEAAVEKVCKESKDVAAGINAALAAAARQREAEIKKAEALRSGVDLTNLPELPFETPGPDAYKNASWPAIPKDPQQGYQSQNPDDKPTAQKATIPETGWFPSKPATNGRVILMYFWHPDVPLSFVDIEKFDLIQRQKGRDVVVVGVLSPLGDANNTYGNQPKIETDPEKLQKKLQDFRRDRKLGHSILLDLNGGLFTTSKTYYQSFQQAVPAPWVAIVSSDGMMRWWGWMGFPAYEAALDKVLLNDPGVQARRRVEDEYIKSKQR